MMKAGWSGRRWACLPVYIVLRFLSCGQFKNLAHLARPVDLARVARYPGCRHRLACDLVEVLGQDAHLAQAAWHAEAADEAIEHVCGVVALMTHRLRNQRLAFCVGH